LPSSLEVGNTIPPFSISNLDVPGVAITEQMMLGKYYLMDFWSTSCGGCIQAMPDHSDMYEKYKGRNFTILSISLDEDQNRITDFRENRYPMPWLNGIAVDGFRDKIAQDFEIGWLPRLYLINPDGVIVAKYDELRGYNLEETLSKYLE
jgi:thiol-disulfide isomerase/thioredoxin